MRNLKSSVTENSKKVSDSEHSNKLDIISTRKKKLIKPLQFAIAFIVACNLLITTVEAQRQVVLTQASFNLAPNMNVVSRNTTVQMLVYRQSTSSSAVWQPDLCFEVKVGNPYRNPADYSSFRAQTPPQCASLTRDVTASCNLKSGTTDTLQFRFLSISTAQSTATMLSLSIANFYTPFSAQQLNITFFAYSDTTCSQLANTFTSQQITILPQSMPFSSVSVTSSSKQLGNSNQNSLIVQFTPLTTMSTSKAGTIKISIPYLYNNVPSFDATQVNTCSSSCMNIYNSRLVGDNLLVIDYNQMTTPCIQNQPITVSCLGYQNPIYQATDEWGFSVSTFDSENKQALIEQSGLSYIDSSKFDPMIIPGEDFQVTPSNFQVNSFSTWILHLSVPIPMVRGCYIKLDIPEDFELRPQQIVALGIFTPPSLVQTLSTTDYIIQPPNQLLRKSSIVFRGCNDGATLGAQPSGDIQFSEISVQKGRFDSDYFGVQIFKDSDLTQMIAYLDKKGVLIEGQVIRTGPIQPITVYPTLNQVVQQKTLMMVNFTISSVLVWGSKVQIKMPVGFTLPEVGTFVEVIGLQATTTANQGLILEDNTVEIQNLVMEEGPRYSGFTFQIAISDVTTQLSAKNAGEIKITTFYLQNSTKTHFQVDEGTNQTSFTATPGPISGNGIKIVIGQPINAAIQTTYKLTFSGQSFVPANGFYTVTIPVEVAVDAQTITKEGSCAKNESAFWVQCSYQAAAKQLKLKSITGFQPNTELSITVAGLTNPRSKQPTSSFIVASLDVDGESLIDQGYNQNIQTSIAGTITDFTVQPGSLVNGDQNTYSFSIKSSIPIEPGDVISYSAPIQVTLPKTNSTKLCFAVDQSQTLTCDISGQSVLVTYLSGPKVSTLNWRMMNVTNPPSVQPTSGFTNVSISDFKSYLVADFNGESNGITNKIAANISQATLFQESLINSTATNYTIKFTPINPLPKEGSMKIKYPSQIVFNNGANTICLVTTNRVYTRNCTIDIESSTITIQGVFSASTAYSAVVSIMLQNVTNPPDNRPGLPGFYISTFADAAQLYIEDVVPDILLVPALTCDYPCATCSNSSRSDCQTCWLNSPDIFLTYRMPYQNAPGRCKSKCDFGFTTNGTISRQCQSCDQSCNGCEDNGLPNDVNKCLACSNDFPFWLQGTQSCLSSCSLGLFESSKGNCSFCNKPCLGCSGSADYCTSCDQTSSKPNLHQNQCLASCPFGFTAIGGVCTACQSPCKSCNGSTSICTSCDGSQGRSIVLTGSCLTSCPNGTVLGADKQSCLQCLSGCSSCDINNSTICLQCNEGLVLVDGNCQGACPPGYELSGSGCVSKALTDLGIMYFPFLIMAAILTAIVLFGKCKKRGQLVHGKSKMVSLQNTLTSELVFISLIQILCNVSLFILAFVFKYYLLCIISLIVAGINLTLSLIYQAFFWSNTISPLCRRGKRNESQLKIKDKPFQDKLFKEYFVKHTFSAILIMVLTGVVNLKFTKMFYSHFYSFDLFKARFTNDTLFMKTMNRFILVSFFLVDVLLIIVGLIGLASIKWNSQVYIECIEVIILSVLSAILTVVESCRLDQILSYIKRQKLLDDSMGLQSFIVKLKLSTKYGHRIIAKSQELLMVEFGGKKCRSIVMHSQNELDQREISSWPTSPTSRHQLKVSAVNQETGVQSLKNTDNVYHDVYQKLKGKDRGTQGNASQVDWQEALNRKHGDLMTQIDIDEEMRIRKGARRRGRKNKYYNQIDQEDDEEVDYEEASDKDADLQIIKEQEEEEEMLRQIVASETQKQAELVAARKSRLVQELSAKENEEKAQAEARRLKLMQEDERRREKELAEALKQEQEIQARKKLQEEAAIESARRAVEEQNKAHQAILASQQARIEYEAQEAARLEALAKEQERIATEEAARVAAEIAAQNLAKQKILEEQAKMRSENDQKLAEQKRLAQEEEDRRRAEEKEALRKQKEKEEADRKAAELALKQDQAANQKKIEQEQNAQKEKAKQEEAAAKEAQKAAKQAEKKAADEAKRLQEIEKKKLQDEKNLKRDEEKSKKLQTQAPKPPAKKDSTNQQSTPKIESKSSTSKIEKVQKESSAPTQIKKQKELLPEAATSVIIKEPTTKVIKDNISALALSELPINEAYMASGNEQSLRNVRSMNQSEDNIDQHSSMIAMNENLLRDFSKKPQGQVDIPPIAELRTFNENDILGDLDRDEKGNLITQERNGRFEDKQGNTINQRGYLLDQSTGAVVDTINRLPMFPAADLDERGELPAPFCIEKFNFNPHNLIGYFDYNEGQPVLLQTSKGFAVDKTGRRVNKKGWLCMGQMGHIVDKWGRKRFDKKQLMNDQDLPKLFTYSGKRFDVRDTIGVFERDQADNIIIQQHPDGYLIDNLGRRVNQKGYLIDEFGNIIDVSGKQLFKVTDLLSHEYPKIFPFTKFNIQKVQGEFNLNPNGTPQLLKQKNGGFADRLGRPVNSKGYLIDARGNVVDSEGNLMFDRSVLENDAEIPQVFRMGLLRSDTASSLSRLMSEIERNNQSEFDRNGYNAQINDSNYEKFRQQDGDTSLDSKMEDTPANYNLANQRFDDREEDQNAIQEDEEGAEHFAPSSGFEDNFDFIPRQKKIRKPKKKKPKVATIEFLEPTKREKNMAGAYGGIARGEIRRPGIKYDKERLANSKKFRVATADEPRVRAQLAQLVNTGFDPEVSLGLKNQNEKPKPKLQGYLGNNTFDQEGNSSQSRQKLGVQKSQKNSELQANKRGMNDGDFEQMFGKDIDKFLEDSEWDIQSADQVSQNSRRSSENGAREVKIKAMEKVYLKRLEANTYDSQNDSKIKRRSELKQNSQSKSPPRQAPVPKQQHVKGPDRETIISFSDNPAVIHRGEVLPFATKWQ